MKEFLNRFILVLIIVAYSAITLALLDQLSLVIVFFGAGCATWRIIHFYSLVGKIPKILLGTLAIITTVIIVFLLYQQGVFSVMLHLIFLGFSLKFLELKSIRDAYFFVNTGFILIALFFIFNTSIFSTFIASGLLVLLLAILLSLHAQTILKKSFLSILIKSCLLSLPLAILLFIVMPRLPTLWKMPIQKQATTGLSDTVTPGEIAQLSRSSELAFRATFKDMIPHQQNLYWRAMTLDHFDGKTWSQSPSLKKQESEAKSGKGQQLVLKDPKETNEYELIIEPHYNYWVPVLDYSLTTSNFVSLRDYSLRSKLPIVNRESVIVTQVNNIKSIGVAVDELAQYSQQLNKENIQTDTWIEEHLNKGVSKADLLKIMLNDFSERFRYTLEPPSLGEAQIDDFLFNTQAGFCVHFASSYLYVARKLGFPARMVTGYLGGEWHPSEGFFTIRQYDAHAWVEVWFNDKWNRIDPTAYVAPERVESGLEAGLTDSDEFLSGEFFSLQKWHSVALINMLRGRIAQLDYLWARYIVNFDNQTQIKLMQKWLSLMPWLKLTYAVMLVMVIIFLVLLIIIFKPWNIKKIASEDKIYLQLQRHFYKQGLDRETGQTVGEYCQLLNVNFNLSILLCNSFAKKYNAIKYATNQTTIVRKKQIIQLKFISKQLRTK